MTDFTSRARIKEHGKKGRFFFLLFLTDGFCLKIKKNIEVVVTVKT